MFTVFMAVVAFLGVLALWCIALELDAIIEILKELADELLND